MTTPGKKKRAEKAAWQDRGTIHRHNYPLEQILTLRQRLTDALAFEFKVPTGPDDRRPLPVVTGVQFERLIKLIYEILPGNLDWQTLEDSVRHLAGTPLTRAALDATAWRLAGNLPRLRCRRVVLPWQVQRFKEWVPFQFTACTWDKSRRGPVAVLDCRALAGTPCGLLVQTRWSLKKCRFLSRPFGFTARPRRRAELPPYPYVSPAQLVLLRFYGLVRPSLCDRGPGFQELAWPPMIQGWNRERLKLRFRIDPGYTCPRGFSRLLACQSCPAGYDDCPAATHKHEWTQRHCPGCGEQGFFDSERSASICVDCVVKESYRK